MRHCGGGGGIGCPGAMEKLNLHCFFQGFLKWRKLKKKYGRRLTRDFGEIAGPEVSDCFIWHFAG